jgi:hypothetical protein
MFELHVVQAMYGDCLLLSYGDPQQPHNILVDGGPPTVYENHLQPLLEQLAAGGQRLERVVLTHTDDDHVVGLVELFRDLRTRQAAGQPPLIAVDGMWMNSFAFDAAVAPSMAHIAIPPAPVGEGPTAGMYGTIEGSDLPIPAQGVAEGVDLRELLDLLHISVNTGVTGGTISLDTPPAPLTAAETNGLALALVGPTKSNLDRMGREWREWLHKHQAPEGAAGAPDLSKRIAPDQSIPNRSSIMFVAEYEGRRVLLTGDGRANDIVRGLVRSGLMASDGVYHVDVLKLPHHGSARNNSRKFFSQVTADTYVISADGTNDNPDTQTLGWLVQAIKEQGRSATLLATNMTQSLDDMLREFSPAIYGYTLEVMAEGSHEQVISLIRAQPPGRG